MSFGSTIGAIKSIKANRKALKKVSAGNLADPKFQKTSVPLGYKEPSIEQLEIIINRIRDKKRKQKTTWLVWSILIFLSGFIFLIFLILG